LGPIQSLSVCIYSNVSIKLWIGGDKLTWTCKRRPGNGGDQ